jgi:hypothetical protein
LARRTALPNNSVGGTVGAARYDQRRAHFGQIAGSGMGAVVKVSLGAAPQNLLLWCMSNGARHY